MSPASQSQDEDPDDLAPLEYARQNGLSEDYLASNLGYPELERLRSELDDDIEVEASLPDFDFGSELKVEDRLSCSKEAASLLSWVTLEESCEAITALVAPLFNDSNSKSKKNLELPLLRTDVDSDFRRFGSRKGFETKLRDVKLPLEDLAEGEGFDWTKQYENLGTEILNELRAEKIGVTRDAIAFLQACGHVTWTEEDERQHLAREHKYSRTIAFDPITPPLSPLPKPPQPFEPSSSDPAMQVPIFSDPLSPTKKDLEAIEEQVFEMDIPTPIRSLSNGFSFDGASENMPCSLGNFLSSPATLQEPPSAELRLPKLEDLKVDVPLMPTSVKTVRFNDDVLEHHFEAASSPLNPDDGSQFFRKFEEVHASIIQMAEQEKLSSEDITARVEIPGLKFDKPDAPWKRFEQVESQAAMLAVQRSFVLDSIASSLSLWPGSRKKECKMSWNPFTTNFAQLSLEEDIQGDDMTWKVFVEDDGDIIDSSSVTWKPAGLRILNNEEDEEEIEYGQFRKDTPPNLSAIVKKRKLQLQAKESSTHNTSVAGAVSKAAGTPLAEKTPKSALTAAESVRGDFGMLGGSFSAQASLDNYLEIRGMKRAKLAESSYFGKPAKTHPAREMTRDDASKLPGLPIRKSPASRQKLPVPSMQPLTVPTWIVVSTIFIKNRAMIKLIEAQLPSVTLVERDFSAHNTSAWMPGSVARSPVKSSLDAEADFIISPSIGIIVATLQQMQQKPLPGAKTKPAIRERLEKVSLRYEKLILLISEGGADDMSAGLVESDCLAFAEFAGFVSGLETSISMQFIGGGHESLSKWIVSSIVQYRVDTVLLADETHWEVFLRRAGLNAFAAQEVIARVKAPDGIDPHSPSKAGIFGLASFVEMGPEERVARFGQICGHRVLARVSAVIDARWE